MTLRSTVTSTSFIKIIQRSTVCLWLQLLLPLLSSSHLLLCPASGQSLILSHTSSSPSGIIPNWSSASQGILSLQVPERRAQRFSTVPHMSIFPEQPQLVTHNSGKKQLYSKLSLDDCAPLFVSKGAPSYPTEENYFDCTIKVFFVCFLTCANIKSCLCFLGSMKFQFKNIKTAVQSEV